MSAQSQRQASKPTMNALGDRCRSVLVLVDAAHDTAPMLDATCGYHVGCVLLSTTPDKAPAPKDLTERVSSFCRESRVACAVEKVTEEVVKTLQSSHVSAIEHLTSPVTLFDATSVKDVASIAAFLTWLYGESEAAAPKTAPRKTPYSLVAVLDVSRGALCTASRDHSTQETDGDANAWLRPTPSCYSELMEAAQVHAASPSSTTANSARSCFVFPVQVYSRQPVVRDRGLQEVPRGEESGHVPVQQWTNKSTLDALLRELAFKAGQLAKYGA